MESLTTTSFVFEEYCLTQSGSETILVCHGHPVPLERPESLTLVKLIKNAGHFIETKSLAKDISQDDTQVIHKAVYGLRGKLHDREGKRFIQTEGKGYRFIASVQTVLADTPEDATLDRPPAEELAARHPTASSDRASQHEGLETSFESWMIGPALKITLILGGLIVGTLILAVVVARQSKTRAASVVSMAQCLMIGFAAVHSIVRKSALQKEQCTDEEARKAGYRDSEDYLSEKPVLQSALRQYRRRWQLLLILWVPLYVAYAWEFWNGDLKPEQTEIVIAHILELIFNIINTIMIVLCYDVLNKDLGQRTQKRRLTGTTSIALPASIVLALLALAISLTPDQIEQLRQHLQPTAALLVGIFAGIVMALFVGRLQSKFLDPPAWVVFFLFSYTAIQPLALYIQNHGEWAWALLWYALVLKSLLYLYVFWLFQSGDLLFYFGQAKRTYDHVDDRRYAHRRLVEIRKKARTS